MPDSEPSKAQMIPDPRQFLLAVGGQWITTDVVFRFSGW
jgi:hypothetical protein